MSQTSPVDRLSKEKPFSNALRSRSRCVLVSLCLCSLLSLVLTSFADFTKSEWQFSKPVETTTSNDDYLRVSVDGEVYRRSLRSLADLRLVDDLGKEVPYS